MLANTSAVLSPNRVRPRDNLLNGPVSTGPTLLAAFLSCLTACVAGHCTHGKKRTSGSAAIRSHRVRKKSRLSDDGIRGNPPLRYDDASDAGVGAKSGSNAKSEPNTKSGTARR